MLLSKPSRVNYGWNFRNRMLIPFVPNLQILFCVVIVFEFLEFKGQCHMPRNMMTSHGTPVYTVQALLIVQYSSL